MSRLSFRPNIICNICLEDIHKVTKGQVLTCCKARDGDKKINMNKSLLLEIAEDHPNSEKVLEIILRVAN